VAGIAPDRISIRIDSTPGPRERAWLAALRGAGSAVTWSGNVVPIAVAVHSVAAPRRGFSVRVASTDGARVSIGDDVGPIDTAEARSGGARFSVPAATGLITARAGRATATAFPQDSLILRRVLVIGAAGWESKFVVSALEEDGWVVDARIHVAHGASVTQGSAGPIDTARYSAVIALDATAATLSAGMARYAATGGGVILAGAAASTAAFAPLRAGVPGRLDASPALASEPGSVTLRSLSLAPISAPRGDAIVLDRRGGAIAAAARRHLAGRVLQHGYTDTWRWRMSGGVTSVADHRAWWTRAVASVAYAPHLEPTGVSPPTPDDAAPHAGLVESVGPATAESGTGIATATRSISLWWLFALLSFCLVAEWASRRLRGLR